MAHVLWAFIAVLAMPVTLALKTSGVPEMKATEIALKAAEIVSKAIPFPANEPYPELIEPGRQYEFRQGSGCGAPPSKDSGCSSSSAAERCFRAPTADDAGWNGFCESKWSLCPDAVANQDYSYYWRGVGPQWVNLGGVFDSQYCLNNGFLKKDIAKLVRNFTALRAEGERQCREKFSAPEFQMHSLSVSGGVMDATQVAMRHKLQHLVRGDLKYSLMDAEAAGIAAAWNCAMGSISCDIAYCNYAYCEMPGGGVGIMDECDGWDAVNGMPSLYD